MDFRNFTAEELFTRDKRLNRTIMDMAIYGAFGFVAGTAASILFKRKAAIRSLGIGFGVGAAYDRNYEPTCTKLKELRRDSCKSCKKKD